MNNPLTDIEKEFIYKYPTTRTKELIKNLGIKPSLANSYIQRFRLKKEKTYKRSGDEEKIEVFTDRTKLGYFSGLIASDGSISSREPNRVVIRLHINDLDVVRSMSMEFLGKDKVGVYPNGNSKCAIFSSSLPKFSEHLKSIGVLSRKTYNMSLTLPEDEGYRLGFLRGFIDGDGHVNESRKRIEIVSYLESPLKELLLISGSGKISVHSKKYHKLTLSRQVAALLPVEDYMMSRKNSAIRLLLHHTP